MKLQNRLSYLIILFVSFLFTQTVKKELPSEQPINVIEKLGNNIPLNLEFINSDGSLITIGDIIDNGIPTIITLNYFECPMLCTLVLNGLSDAIKNSDLMLGKDFQVITVDLNPNEPLSLIREKKENYLGSLNVNIDDNSWYFLKGTNQNISKLADILGVEYYYDSDRDEYMHPAVITFVDSQSKITRYLYGIAYPSLDFKLAILETGQGKIGSTVDKILLYCYHYDPYKNTYTLFATNFMRLGGIFTIIFLAIMLVKLWKNDTLIERKND